MNFTNHFKPDGTVAYVTVDEWSRETTFSKDFVRTADPDHVRMDWSHWLAHLTARNGAATYRITGEATVFGASVYAARLEGGWLDDGKGRMVRVGGG